MIHNLDSCPDCGAMDSIRVANDIYFCKECNWHTSVSEPDFSETDLREELNGLLKDYEDD